MAPQRTTFSSFFAKAKDANISIEISKLILEPVDAIAYLEKFNTVTTPSSMTTQSFVKMFHQSQNKSYDVKLKNFGTNKTNMFNESKNIFDLDKKSKVIATKIQPINAVPQTASHVELTTRFSFDLINHPYWMLQVDLVKTFTNPIEFASRLPSAKKLLVGVPLDKMDLSAYDYVETVLVKMDDSPITHTQMLELINDVESANENMDNEEYQKKLYSLAKDIFRDAETIAQFKRQSGFKRLGSNTIELSRPIYFKQVLPVIESFYMTDKMDGIRAMLIIDEVYRRSGHRRIYLGSNIEAVSDQVYTITSFQSQSNSKTIETDHTVLDVEMMVDAKGNKSFHCFDVIALQSKRIANLPFKERFTKFQEVKTLMEKYELGDVKTFIKLSKETFAKQLTEFYNMKRAYHIDGLIFTPEGTYHRDAMAKKKNKFERIFNTNYVNTVSFKWKPLDQLTIDFYLMTHPKKKGSYILCSGVDKKTFDRLQMSFFDGYKSIDTPNAHQYFPIQFESSHTDFNYEWTPSDEEKSICELDEECHTLNGMVGEFKFATDNKLLDKPQLIRLRTDRVQDIAKGEYYGNNIRYAELIYHSIQNPLTIEAMCDGNGAGYFADTNDWYKEQRSFNSFVKTYLMETYLYPTTQKARLMDIACGRGQDLARTIELGFDEVVLMDKDVDALYELLDRKYDLRIKRKGASANIHIKQLDLEQSSDHNIKSLKLPAESSDHAMINFALHYICYAAGPNKIDPLTEFAKLCSYYLKSKGCLMITTFNGADVFELLTDKEEWSLKENNQTKYSIKKAFSSTVMTNNNQAIDVLLPFSAGAYYREYLVNYEHVQNIFEANGFKMIASDNFGSLLRLYKTQNRVGYTKLTDADKEYVNLYSYMIFQKE